MRTFDYIRLANQTWDIDILNLVAKIQSTEVSNKIEEIITTNT